MSLIETTLNYSNAKERVKLTMRSTTDALNLCYPVATLLSPVSVEVPRRLAPTEAQESEKNEAAFTHRHRVVHSSYFIAPLPIEVHLLKTILVTLINYFHF